VGRAGQQKNTHSVFLDPEPGRGALLVFEPLRAFRHQRLARVVGGHRPAQAREALLEALADLGDFTQRTRERLRHHLAVDVVFGGSKPAGENDQIGTVERRAQDAGQALAVISHHGLEPHLNAQGVELFREVKRVGIQPIRGEQLGADRDDFCIHPENRGSGLGVRDSGFRSDRSIG